MTENKVSIVFVTYNNLDYLEKSHRSISGLGKIVSELIVVDSSSDLRIKNYLEFNSEFKFKYKWEAPQGIYHAMNSALSLAEDNDFIWYLNPPDQLIDKDVLRKLLYKIGEKKSSWGYAQALKELNGKKEIYPLTLIKPTVESIASGKLSISHQAMLVKVSELRSIGGFDQNFLVAADLKAQILLVRNFFPTFVMEPLVAIDPTGISHQRQIQTFTETFRIRLLTKDFSKRLVFYITFRNLFIKFLNKVLNFYKALR